MGRKKGGRLLGALALLAKDEKGETAPGICPIPPLENTAHRWHLGKENFRFTKAFPNCCSELLFGKRELCPTYFSSAQTELCFLKAGTDTI